jgi:hypothetical protein
LGSFISVLRLPLSETRQVRAIILPQLATDRVLQLIHVYAKNYEGNGRLILIRLVRYSLDGEFVFWLYESMYSQLSRFDAVAGQFDIVLAIVSLAAEVSMHPGCFFGLHGGPQENS